jgi:hypothetical protein
MGGDLTAASSPPAAVATAGWRVAAASVQGAAHVRAGTPCQDAHRWSALRGGWLVAAVADGAGSAPLAETGARIAADTVVDRVRDALAADGGADLAAVLESAFRAALEAVRAEAEGRGVDPSDLATTLAAAVATPARVVAAQVGDGAVVVRAPDGSLHAPTADAAPRGEYLNETVFLTSPGALEALRVAAWDAAPSHLALLTDGLQLLALRMPGGTPHAPFFEPLFRFAAEAPDPEHASERLRAYLAGPRVAQRADDDLTLLLAALA